MNKKRFRSSHSEVFCKQKVLKHFPKFTGKHLSLSLFLIGSRCQACNFTKKDSSAGASILILQNSFEQLLLCKLLWNVSFENRNYLFKSNWTIIETTSSSHSVTILLLYFHRKIQKVKAIIFETWNFFGQHCFLIHTDIFSSLDIINYLLIK